MNKIVILFVAALLCTQCLAYPLFKQCDSRWGNQEIGISSETICQVGCLMSSVSMVLNGFGVTFDGAESNPGTFDHWLTYNGGYASGDLFIWSSINRFGFSFQTNSLPRSQVEAAINSGKIVILNVRGGSHWVLATGMGSNGAINVNDPGFNQGQYDINDVVAAGVYVRTGVVNQKKGFLLSQAQASCGSCDDIQTMIAESEGNESCVYNDSLGIPTIGIGFNLQRSDAPSLIASVGADYNSVLNGSQCLSSDQITQLFQNDLNNAVNGASNCVGSYSSQPQCVQNVLIDMSFNMGPAALCSWPNFVSQLANFDYADAASNMQGSTWCGQVGNRCTRDVNIIAGCTGTSTQ